ncbi:hypothetical protein JCM10908_002614 [Rhodotorula pacifica]|uniref:uncharacterized protein n=1 Tax=Rhodotorula pacifica TaxID=1495444 RepID=UPI00316AF102
MSPRTRRSSRIATAAHSHATQTNDSVPLLTLPDELLTLVFAELSPVQAIDANVCRRLRPFARARIMSQITLRHNDQLRKFKSLLPNHPACSAVVRELAILSDFGSARTVELIKTLPGLTKLVLCKVKCGTLSALLLDAKAPDYLGNLKCLQLFADKDEKRFWQNPRTALWADYLAFWPSLQELHLYAVDGVQILPTAKSKLKPFRTLKRLHLRLTALDQHDILDMDRVFPSLEELTIEETQRQPTRFRPILRKISPTNLRKLDLRPAPATNADSLGSTIDDLLPQFVHLERMHFAAGLYNPVSLEHVLPRLVSLRYVEFSSGAKVTSGILDALLVLPALEEVLLNHAAATWGPRIADEGPPSNFAPFHMWPGWNRPCWDHSNSDLSSFYTSARNKGVDVSGTAIDALGWADAFINEAETAIALAKCPRCHDQLQEYVRRRGL